MNTNKLVAVLLTVLMVGSAFAVAQPVAAQADDPVVSLQPADAEVQPGETQTFEIVVENIDNGVGAYDIEVGLDSTNVATFVATEGGLNGDGSGETEVTEDSVSLSHVYFNEFPSDGDAVASVTVETAAEGDTALSLTDVSVNDPDGNTYDTTAEGATLTVSEPDRVPEQNDVLGVSLPADQRTVVDRPAQHFTNADFEQANIQLLSEEGAVDQQLQVQLDINETAGTSSLLVDYNESTERFVTLADASVGSGPLQGAVENVDIRNDLGELEIEFDAATTGDVVGQTQTLDLKLVGAVTGDGSVRHVVEFENVPDSASSTRYRLTNRGATAIAPEDALNGGGIDLAEEDGPVDSEIDPDRTGSQAAFDIWQGQSVTFQVAENSNTVEIYEYELESDDVVRRGARVTRVGTAPGSVTNFDTSELEAGERYIVEFVGYDGYAVDADPVVVLDVDPLNLEAEASSEEFRVDQPVEIDVSADDISGGDIRAFFFDEDFETVVTTVDSQLDGSGQDTVRATPNVDLEGAGEYNVLVQHRESEVSTAPVSFTVVGGPPAIAGADPPTDPDGDDFYEDIDGDGEFDIFDIQALFNNLDNPVLQENAAFFDFDGNEGEEVDIFDVQALFNELS